MLPAGPDHRLQIVANVSLLTGLAGVSPAWLQLLGCKLKSYMRIRVLGQIIDSPESVRRYIYLYPSRKVTHIMGTPY